MTRANATHVATRTHRIPDLLDRQYMNFSAFMVRSRMFAPYHAFDAGAGNGNFATQLAQDYPGWFDAVTSVDLGLGTDRSDVVRRTYVRWLYQLEAVAYIRAGEQPLDLFFFNAPEAGVYESSLEEIARVGPPGAIVVYTAHFERILNELFNGAENPVEVAKYYFNKARELSDLPYRFTVIPNLAHYPWTDFALVPGILIGQLQ